MHKIQYYIADVFCEDKYSGNQLAIVLANHDLSDDEMQRIANEFHFAETSFILSPQSRNTSYDVRIFTPRREVPFAGHPTLGTAYIINTEILPEPAETIYLSLKVGTIPVTFTPGMDTQPGWMTQNEPTFSSIYNPSNIAKIINVSNEDIDTRYPIQEVSTGLPFIIIPLKDLQAVKRANTNTSLYSSYFTDETARPLFMFCPETYNRDNQVNCRMFANFFGIPEDPATGSANGCLAGYLVKYRYFNKTNINIRVEQGYEIGRKSLLHLKAEEDNGRISIRVGGRVIKVAEGYLV